MLKRFISNNFEFDEPSLFLVNRSNNYTLDIAPTFLNPKVHLSFETKSFLIEGKWIPLTPNPHYYKTKLWIDDHIVARKKNIELNFKLTLTNSLSLNIVAKISKEILAVRKSNKVFWYYNECDTDIKDYGQMLQSVIGKNFKLLPSFD
jgi:hypothetical protein